MMTMKLAVTASILLGLAGVLVAPGRASAQPGMVEPTLEEPPAPPPPRPPDQGGELLSEGTALGYSLVGTFGSWGLLLAAGQLSSGSEQVGSVLAAAGAVGVMFGPSFGHWYAGKYVTRGLGLRALGLATVVTGAMVALAECPLFSEEPCDDTGGAIIALAGVGLFVGGTIDDIVTAPRRARRHNDRVSGRVSERISGLMLAPRVSSRSAGLAVIGRF